MLRTEKLSFRILVIVGRLDGGVVERNRNELARSDTVEAVVAKLTRSFELKVRMCDVCLPEAEYANV